MSEAYTIKVHNRKCRVCKRGFDRDTKFNQHIPDNRCCSECQHWIDQIMYGGNPIIVNGEHYRAGLGGGMKVNLRIEFFDGRVDTIDHLWHQGTIPERFRGILEDNARMIRL